SSVARQPSSSQRRDQTPAKSTGATTIITASRCGSPAGGGRGGRIPATPSCELPTPGSSAGKINGRDHNHYGFTMWLAGGGVRGGHIHGATDEFGFKAVQDRVHIHDLHATLLHLLGLDHER